MILRGAQLLSWIYRLGNWGVTCFTKVSMAPKWWSQKSIPAASQSHPSHTHKTGSSSGLFQIRYSCTFLCRWELWITSFPRQPWAFSLDMKKNHFDALLLICLSSSLPPIHHHHPQMQSLNCPCSVLDDCRSQPRNKGSKSCSAQPQAQFCCFSGYEKLRLTDNDALLIGPLLAFLYFQPGSAFPLPPSHWACPGPWDFNKGPDAVTRQQDWDRAALMQMAQIRSMLAITKMKGFHKSCSPSLQPSKSWSRWPVNRQPQWPNHSGKAD